jgi:hypothetical protein
MRSWTCHQVRLLFVPQTHLDNQLPSSERSTPVPTSETADMEVLRNRILTSHASKLPGELFTRTTHFLLFINDKSAESISGASDYSVDNASEIHAPGHGIPSTSMQTVQLSAHFHSQSSTAPTLIFPSIFLCPSFRPPRPRLGDAAGYGCCREF